MEEPKRYTLDIRASIREGYGGGYLNVEENVSVTAADFFEMARILGEFHKLAQTLKAPDAS